MGATQRTAGAPAYVVLRRVGEDLWQLVGEAERRPGETARRARARAVVDATAGTAEAGQVYAAVLRSEWRVALDLELEGPPAG
jgi:hypothetical protein